MSEFSRKSAGLGLVASGVLVLCLAGCGAGALVGATATATGQVVKTTSKAAGVAARATIGGAKAVGRLATRPFRDKSEDDAKAAAFHKER